MEESTEAFTITLHRVIQIVYGLISEIPTEHGADPLESDRHSRKFCGRAQFGLERSADVFQVFVDRAILERLQRFDASGHGQWITT